MRHTLNQATKVQKIFDINKKNRRIKFYPPLSVFFCIAGGALSKFVVSLQIKYNKWEVQHEIIFLYTLFIDGSADGMGRPDLLVRTGRRSANRRNHRVV